MSDKQTLLPRNLLNWIVMMSKLDRDAPYWSNGMFVQDCADAIDALSSCAVVPVEPTPGLLMSMAIRYDHGLGVPGYYDSLSEAFSIKGHKGPMPTHDERLQSTLRTMRQLHEEVVGTGFYRPEKEAEYVGWSKGDPPPLLVR